MRNSVFGSPHNLHSMPEHIQKAEAASLWAASIFWSTEVTYFWADLVQNCLFKLEETLTEKQENKVAEKLGCFYPLLKKTEDISPKQNNTVTRAGVPVNIR